MELFYSLCCSELSCSPHRTPFTLYQWRPSSTLARATVHTPVSTRLPGKQDIWVWQWTLKCFDIYISSFISENSFQKQHFCSSCSNINFRMITKMGLTLIKKKQLYFENSDCNGYVCFENQNSWENILTIIVKGSSHALLPLFPFSSRFLALLPQTHAPHVL